MQHKLLIANWKANPSTLEEARALFEAENKPGVVICPPAVYIAELRASGSQDVFWESGAHTGQLSPDMLKQFGVTHVLVGHSERRAVGETDEMINKKIKALLASDITPVLLIGEIDQLTRDLNGVSADDAQKILFTYEPAWAISTNPNAHPSTPKNAVSTIHEMQSILDKMYKFKPAMLYGGSVNVSNIADFLKHPEISGAVVGGASLRADEFKKMIEIASKL